MVLIVYKKSQKNSFALQCSLQTKISTVLSQLVLYNNLRVYLDRLIWTIEQLANKGILKPPQLQGVSWQDYQKNQKQFLHLSQQVRNYGKKPKIEPPYRYVADKHHQRYGVILPDQTKQIMIEAVNNGKSALQFKGTQANKQQLINAVQKLRQSVMTAYPAYIDLPEWQPSLLMLEEKVDLQMLQTDNLQIFDERATVWWAGKQLEKNKMIGQYVGKNEKTKVIIKIQKWGGQQPLRQPPIDSETYSKMVKFYYKKVEEAKQFQKHSVQAHYEKVETRNLKAQLHVGENIVYKPF